jgi:large subunit ribosomal protein L35
MKDSATLKKVVDELKVVIQQEEAASEKDEDALEKKRKKLHILEVQSEINLPEVRWKVANGMGE